jgi:hypothetical protein
MLLESTFQISPAESPLPVRFRERVPRLLGEDGTYAAPPPHVFYP